MSRQRRKWARKLTSVASLPPSALLHRYYIHFEASRESSLSPSSYYYAPASQHDHREREPVKRVKVFPLFFSHWRWLGAVITISVSKILSLTAFDGNFIAGTALLVYEWSSSSGVKLLAKSTLSPTKHEHYYRKRLYIIFPPNDLPWCLIGAVCVLSRRSENVFPYNLPHMEPLSRLSFYPLIIIPSTRGSF